MNGVRVRPNAQIEADAESVAGLPEWVQRQPGVHTVCLATDVEDRVAEHLRRGIRFSDTGAVAVAAAGLWRIAYRTSTHLPAGTVAAFDEHGVLLAMAVL